MDGRSFQPLLGVRDAPWRDATLMEGFPLPKVGRPAYAGVWTGEENWYVEYKGGEKEIYDVGADPSY